MFRKTIGLLSVGAAAMYFYDPQQGEQRRQAFSSACRNSYDAIRDDMEAANQEVRACFEGELPVEQLLFRKGQESEAYNATPTCRLLGNSLLAFLGLKVLSALGLRGVALAGLGLAACSPELREEITTRLDLATDTEEPDQSVEALREDGEHSRAQAPV